MRVRITGRGALGHEEAVIEALAKRIGEALSADLRWVSVTEEVDGRIYDADFDPIHLYTEINERI